MIPSRNHSKKYSKVFHFEELESRELLSGAQPTPVEQVLLERLNDIRENPAAYGTSIGLNLSNVSPSQPLAFDPLLVTAARGHSVDMNNNRFFSHYSSSGRSPGHRMQQAGFRWTYYGESIAAGYGSPEAALQALIVDAGVPNLGHRRHLLAIDSVFKSLNRVGVGIVEGGSGPMVNYFTIDSASSSDKRPILTGSVFNDINGNGKYDVNEGVGNLTLEVHGVGTITTFDAGGYSFPVKAGTYTVTFSGGDLAGPITKTVTVGNTNFRLNVLTNEELPDNKGETNNEQNKAELTANELWVSQLVQNLYKRDITPSELVQWSAYLEQGGSRDAVVANLVDTPEFERIKVSLWVADTGEALLGRSLSESEIDLYTDQITSGLSKQNFVYNLLVQEGFHSLSNGQWLDKLSDALLGRSLSAYERSAWVNYLNRGGSRYVSVLVFMGSTEYQQREASQFVNQWAETFLGSSLSAGETYQWSVYLRYGGSSATFMASLLNRQ